MTLFSSRVWGPRQWCSNGSLILGTVLLDLVHRGDSVALLWSEIESMFMLLLFSPLDPQGRAYPVEMHQRLLIICAVPASSHMLYSLVTMAHLSTYNAFIKVLLQSVFYHDGHFIWIARSPLGPTGLVGELSLIHI